MFSQTWSESCTGWPFHVLEFSGAFLTWPWCWQYLTLNFEESIALNHRHIIVIICLWSQYKKLLTFLPMEVLSCFVKILLLTELPPCGFYWIWTMIGLHWIPFPKKYWLHQSCNGFVIAQCMKSRVRFISTKSMISTPKYYSPRCLECCTQGSMK